MTLHLLGIDIQQRLKDCDAPNENNLEGADEYEQAKLQLRLLLKLQVRTIHARNIFHIMNLTDRDENVRDFVVCLQKQADRCSFSGAQRDKMIRDILIARCPHQTLQVRLLEAQKLMTEDAIKIWESYLQVRTQCQKLQEMNVKEKDPSPETEQTVPQQENVNKVREKYQAHPSRSESGPTTIQPGAKCPPVSAAEERVMISMPAVQQRDRHATSVEAKIILPESAGLHRRGVSRQAWGQEGG